jgi:hypothetical protein
MDIYLPDRHADILQVSRVHGPSVVNEVAEELHDELAYATLGKRSPPRPLTSCLGSFNTRLSAGLRAAR